MPRNVLSLTPTTNFAMASGTDKSDKLESLSRALMGLSHPLSIISQAREVVDTPYADWPMPPKLIRRWMAVVEGADDDELAWRTDALSRSLRSAGLRTSVLPDLPQLGEPTHQSWRGVQDDTGQWSASLALRRWPREVAPGWLGHALSTEMPIDVGIHVQPQDSQRVARFLKHQQEWQSSGGMAPDAANDLGAGDAESVRRKLIARTDRPIKVAVALTTFAPDQATLRPRLDTVKHEVGLALADARPVTFEHDLGRRATEPTGECNLRGVWRTLDCTSVASTWPFQPATIDHDNGAPIGVTHHGRQLVKLDPFDPDLESFGGLVLAKVGMGKSYLLKLLATRLKDVEIWIVEQRTPAEYAGIPNTHSVNLQDVPYAERAAKLREFIESLWRTAQRDPRPRLLVLDELWALLRDEALGALVEEIARIGRHRYLSLWIATQQVAELLASPGGQAVLSNTAIRIFLKQHDFDLDKLSVAVGMPAPARHFLRTAERGQALFDLKGMIVPVDIQASAREHAAITTDPRERALLRAA